MFGGYISPTDSVLFGTQLGWIGGGCSCIALTLGRVVYRELLMSEGPGRRFTAEYAENAERN